MQKKWLICDKDLASETEQLKSALGVDKLIAEMLYRRGIKTPDAATQFFAPKLTDLYDPFLMKDMDKAVQRLVQAIDRQENVIIYGDYDVDGTTSVALCYSYLKDKLLHLDYYIPDRYDEGYGLSEKAVREAASKNVDLIITLDCGIRANENIALGNSLGIDFIVCDHHTPGEELPAAIVLDPKRKDCDYPYQELCGCGVGFKLLSALAQTKDYPLAELHDYLDYVAIAIGADIVPITGENRTLCALGLAALNASPRLGIAVLLELAQRPIPLTLTDVVFVIAPRINAAGRMLHAKEAVALLITKDREEANAKAKMIHAANAKRKETYETVKNEALNLLEADEKHAQKCTNVVFGKGWHKGVIGIVASRLIEQYYRPTVVFTQPEPGDLLTASARTAGEINVYDALNKCSDLFEKFGGHAHAAGLSIQESNYAVFCERFDQEVRKMLGEEQLIPEEHIECEVQFNEIVKPGDAPNKLPNLKKVLDKFEPHGPGNMKPVFLATNVFPVDFRVLKELHLKCSFKQTSSDIIIDGICFNRPDLIPLLQAAVPLEVVFTLETNTWRNQSKLQLNIKDIRPENGMEYAE